MSRTFSTNFGPFGSLKVSPRCGFRPCSRQMPWMMDGARPLAFAIERNVQGVAAGGTSRSVRSTTAAIRSGEAAAKARPRGASRNKPPAPSCM